MKSQTKEEIEVAKRVAKEKQQKEENLRRKKEEYKEAQERQNQNRAAAEEAALRLGKKKHEWYTNPYYLVFGALGALLVYVLLMLFMNKAPALNKTPVIDEKRIAEHNDNFPWSQGSVDFWEGATLADAKKLFTTSFASHSNLMKCIVDETIAIPDNFDTRVQWEECKLPVSNQGLKCDGSYALSIASALSERLCISSSDRKLTPLSAQELLSCDMKNKGCKGGFLNDALDYIRVKGLAEQTCLPYQGDNVTCDKMCENPIKERIHSYCVVFGEEDIKREILKNGPVVAVTQVYSDFLSYKKGVYIKGDDVPRFSGMIGIKVIGWGVESGNDEINQGNKYWLVENTWGADWGENGVAKIAMGQGLLFEQYAYGLKTPNEMIKTQAAQAQSQAKENVQVDASDIPDMNLDEEKK